MSEICIDYQLYSYAWPTNKYGYKLDKYFFSRSSESSGKDNHVQKQLSLSVTGLKAIAA